MRGAVAASALAAPVIGRAAAEQATIAKMNIALPPSDLQVIALQKFADTVKERTGGALEIRIFPSNELGSDAQSLDDMKIGVIEATCVPSSQYIQYAPDFKVLDLPFLFRDGQHARKAMPTIISLLSPALTKAGIYPLFGAGVSAHDLAAVFPIHRLSDMKGKKVRTVESPITLRTWKLLGANPTPIPSQEVYLALQTRIVDSVDTSATSYLSFKRYEVAKHFAKVETAQYFFVVGFSSAWIQKLPKKLMETLESTAHESAGDDLSAAAQQGDDAALASAQKLQFEIDTIEDRDAWVAATAPVREDVAKSSPVAKELIARIAEIS